MFPLLIDAGWQSEAVGFAAVKRSDVIGSIEKADSMNYESLIKGCRKLFYLTPKYGHSTTFVSKVTGSVLWFLI